MKRALLMGLTIASALLLGCASVQEIATEVAKDQADKVRAEVREQIYIQGEALKGRLETKSQEFKEEAAKAKEEGDTTRWLLYSALGLGAGGGAVVLGKKAKKTAAEEKTDGV